MSLFGGHAKPSNFDQIAELVRTHLGLQIARPSADVLEALDKMSSRELHQFENLHSIEGMRALFQAHSIQSFADPNTNTIALFLGEPAGEEQQPQRPVLHIGERHATQSIVRPQNVKMLGEQPLQTPLPAQAAANLPAALEHLEALENLLPQIVDLFVRHGRLNTADKDVIKQIRPADSSIEARITALERWQAEVGRRVRGIHVQRATTHLLLNTEEVTQQAKPEEIHARRFDTIIIWISKLIKAFEHTGVKFHNKPMWLPH